MELEKPKAIHIKSMKRKRIRTATLILLSMAKLSYGQLDTFNMTVRLDDKVIIDKGLILSTRVKIVKSNVIEPSKSVYLIKNIGLDSVPITLLFKNHSAEIIIIDLNAINEINLLKSTFKTSSKWQIFKHVKYNFICPSYGINYHNGTWVTRFWVIKNNKRLCKFCID